MKRFISGVLTSVLISASSVGLTTSPAAAYQGCNSPVQNRADNWSVERKYMTFDRIPVPVKIRITHTTEYVFCPDGKNKIKPYRVEDCYSWIVGRDRDVTDVAVDQLIWDEDTTVDPGENAIPSDGTVQNCKSKRIPREDRRWLLMKQGPRMSAVYEIVRSGPIPNLDGEFKNAKGGDIKLLTPSNDFVVRDWYV